MGINSQLKIQSLNSFESHSLKQGENVNLLLFKKKIKVIKFDTESKKYKTTINFYISIKIKLKLKILNLTIFFIGESGIKKGFLWENYKTLLALNPTPAPQLHLQVCTLYVMLIHYILAIV